MKKFDFYLLRIPVYSLDFFFNINARINHEPEKFCEIIEELQQDTWFLEALKYASPALLQEFQRYSSTKGDKRRIAISIYKYLSRMCGRSTPFGLFSGVALGTIKNESNISITKTQLHKPSIRMDMEYLTNLSYLIQQLPEVRTQTNYTLNHTLYKINYNFRYTEYDTINGLRNYKISSINNFDFLEDIIKKYRDNDINMGNFISFCVSEKINKETAITLFNDLIDNQVFISETDLNITGQSYLNRLINTFEPFPDLSLHRNKLLKLKQHLHQVNNGTSVPQDTDIAISEVFQGVSSTHLLQADLMISTASNAIEEKVRDLIVSDLGKLIATFASPALNTDMDSFKASFIERYGEEEVPLTMALDPDSGIAYGSSKIGETPLIEDMTYMAAKSDLLHEPISKLKLSLINRSYLGQGGPVVLTEEDLSALSVSTKNQDEYRSPLYYTLGSLFINTNKTSDSLDYKFEVKALINGNAANLMSRFSHLSEEIESKVQELVNEETDGSSDWIDAEIIHLSASGEGNVILRPTLRAFEIPFATIPGLTPDKQLPINDLYLSVRHNKLILRSGKHNKIVRPRLTTAHNYSTGLPIYKFLCCLQKQELSGSLNWSWGPLDHLAYCPRIEYRNIILSKAKWTFLWSQLKEPTLDALKELVAQYTTKWELPHQVSMVNRDNELWLDLRLDVSIEILFDYLKKNGELCLKEFLFTTDNSPVKRSEEYFSNEIILPFVYKTTPADEDYSLTKYQQKRTKKSFYVPGEECLYLKIYCGEKIIDSLLTNEINKIVNQQSFKDKVDRWFFVRYHDPSSHLRIRFFSKDTAYLNTVLLPLINKRISHLLTSRTIWNIQLDVYKRELFRYGNHKIDQAEEIFYQDSMKCISILSYLKKHIQDEEYRVMAGLMIADHYLDESYSTINQKHQFCATQKQYFLNEFASRNSAIKESLKQKFRNYRPYLNDLLAPDPQTKDVHLKKIRRMIKVQDHIIKPAMQINDIDATASYIHMSLNRLFLTEQRLHELFIYDILENFYKSVLGRQKSLSNAGKH